MLSGSKYPVSDKVRKKVLAAAREELNYVPNIFGQLLRSNSSGAIGIIVPSLQNPFYNQVVFGIESAAMVNGHEIRLFSSHRSVEQERSSIMFLLHSRVSLPAHRLRGYGARTRSSIISTPAEQVALLEAEFELDNAINAVSDSYLGGRMAARHLVDYGHERLPFSRRR